MRKIAKWATLILIVGLLFAGIGALMGGVNSVTFDHGFRIVRNGTITHKLGQVKQLNLDVTDTDVELVAGQQASVTVSGPEVKATKVNLSAGILTISRNSSLPSLGFDFVSNHQPHVKIVLPQKTLAQLDLNLNSGDLSIQQVAAKTATITLGSGDMTVNQLSVTNQGEFKNNSGDIDLSHVTLNKVTGQLNSGELSIDNSTLTEFNATNNSGDTDIEHTKLSGIIGLTNHSGDVELNNSDTTGYRLKADSGDISVHDAEHSSPYNQEPNAADRLEITSASGDIDIE